MSRITILPAVGHRTMSWKNGGGSTTEIAVSPEGADLAGFDWRISMARVDGPGPFSTFPGIDRTLCLLQGEAVVLDGLGPAPIRLTASSDPFAFPADVPVHGTPLGGPITDLNVMTRRGRMVHAVTRLNAGMPAMGSEAGDVVVIVATSAVTLDGTEDGPITLAPRDALRIAGATALHLTQGAAYGIRLRVAP